MSSGVNLVWNLRRSWIRVKGSIFPGKFSKISIFSGPLHKNVDFLRQKLVIYALLLANYSISLQKSPLSNIGLLPMGARRNFSRGVQTQWKVKGWMAQLSSVYLWNTNTCCDAVVFHSVSLGQTLCMNSVLQKTEKQNLGGCKCTTFPLHAGALATSCTWQATIICHHPSTTPCGPHDPLPKIWGLRPPTPRIDAHEDVNDWCSTVGP